MNKLQNIIKDLQIQRFTLDKLNEILDIIDFKVVAFETLDLIEYKDDLYIEKYDFKCSDFDNGLNLTYNNKYVNIYENGDILKIDLYDENNNNIDSVYFEY